MFLTKKEFGVIGVRVDPVGIVEDKNGLQCGATVHSNACGQRGGWIVHGMGVRRGRPPRWKAISTGGVEYPQVLSLK
jgi:hypothetical protein